LAGLSWPVRPAPAGPMLEVMIGWTHGSADSH
jgi:hypothetical protein